MSWTTGTADLGVVEVVMVVVSVVGFGDLGKGIFSKGFEQVQYVMIGTLKKGGGQEKKS